MTSYFPPAVVGYVTETSDLFRVNRTDMLSTNYILGTGELSTPQSSYGGQTIRIYGTNFGRVDLAEAVRAWYLRCFSSTAVVG